LISPDLTVSERKNADHTHNTAEMDVLESTLAENAAAGPVNGFPANLASPLPTLISESVMLKSKLLDAIRTEIRRHDLSHFQDGKDKMVRPGVRRAAKPSTLFRSSSTT
jgi:hypothetical protein